MIFCVKDFLEQKGTDKRRSIWTVQQQRKILKTNTPAADNGAQSTITVKADGRSFDIGFALTATPLYWMRL